MAKLDPEGVTKVVLRIPETENIHVNDDLADIALVLPGDLSARLIPQAKSWIRAPYGLVLPHKLGALVAKLAEEGQTTAALDLAGTLLEVLPDPQPVLVPEPIGHMDAWHYERVLKQHIAVLVAIAGMPALELLTSLLADAVRLNQKDPNVGDFEDYSFVSRPFVEHGRGFSRGVTDPLISAVVDAATHVVSNNQAAVSDVVAALERREWRLFHRIALHILKVFGDRAPDNVAQNLKNPARNDHFGSAREFWLLAELRFKTLSPIDREPLLEWIKAGPDLEAYRRRWKDFTGQSITEQDAAGYGDRWRRDRLAVLHDGLSEEWRKRYEALVSELGPAEDIGGARGITGPGFSQLGPKLVADLQTMPMEEIVAYLKS